METITLDFKKYDDPQSIFIATVNALVAQGALASTDSIGCVYRQPLEDGTVRKCAFGLWIPDELYLDCMENNGACVLIPVYFTRLGEPEEELGVQFTNWCQRHEELILHMQELHDNFFTDGAADDRYFWRQVTCIAIDLGGRDKMPSEWPMSNSGAA